MVILPSGEIFYLIRMILPLTVLYLTDELDFGQRQLQMVIEGISGTFFRHYCTF